MGTRRLDAPALRLGAFGVLLALTLGAGALVGAAVGPEPSIPDEQHGEEHAGAEPAPAADVPGGLAVSRAGYTLALRTPTVEPDAPADLAFVIEGPDGQAVTDYDVEHDQELHLVIVRRDLTNYAHVHPARDTDGLWSVTAPALEPGSYRVYADFVPAGGEGLTLGADLAVPGRYSPVALPEPAPVASVDGYDVHIEGELVGGTESDVTVTISRGGEPVTDLEPYLGALAHLVAIRDGDLAYLHVHPLDETDTTGGPSVRFAVEVPTAGTYGLFVDFAHDGDVRTASTIATAHAEHAPADDHGD